MRPKLALSLNASNDSVREQIAADYEEVEYCEAAGGGERRFRWGSGEWVTFEYVMLVCEL